MVILYAMQCKSTRLHVEARNQCSTSCTTTSPPLLAQASNDDAVVVIIACLPVYSYSFLYHASFVLFDIGHIVFTFFSRSFHGLDQTVQFLLFGFNGRQGLRPILGTRTDTGIVMECRDNAATRAILIKFEFGRQGLARSIGAGLFRVVVSNATSGFSNRFVGIQEPFNVVIGNGCCFCTIAWIGGSHGRSWGRSCGWRCSSTGRWRSIGTIGAVGPKGVPQNVPIGGFGEFGATGFHPSGCLGTGIGGFVGGSAFGPVRFARAETLKGHFIIVAAAIVAALLVEFGSIEICIKGSVDGRGWFGG
mmetsp:Transcript_19359/g.47852  ORF Transcript_19359/g.47852 Transcript_19359/m.47852 type:complete len:305 (+) Transcript_19359:79-993(+)